MRSECGRFGWISGCAACMCLAASVLGGEAAPKVGTGQAGTPAVQSGQEAPQVRVLVAYYSRRGNTEKMAQAVVEGAQRVQGVAVVAKKIDAVTKEDLQAADGLILGCPTYFANIPGVMKTAIDDWNWKLKVDFTDKVGGAFATGGGQTGGKEHVVVSLLLFMINNRMLVAGPLYQDETGKDIWGEMGSTAMTGPLDPGIGTADIDGAQRLGERIARLAKKLKRHLGELSPKHRSRNK